MYCLLVLYAFIFISSFHLLLVLSICQELSSSEQRNTRQRQRNNDNVTSTMWQQQWDNDNMTTTMWQRQCATTTWQQQCDNMFWLLWYELDVKNKTATICWSHWSQQLSRQLSRLPSSSACFTFPRQCQHVHIHLFYFKFYVLFIYFVIGIYLLTSLLSH